MPDDEQPAPQRATPRVDHTRADMGTLVAMGWADPQPVASPDPPGYVPPAPEPDPPTPAEVANEAVLQAALAEAGVTKSAADEDAIDVLSQMDPAAVQAVARWMKAKKDATGKT